MTMKALNFISLTVLAATLFFSCDKEISLDLADSDPFVSIDAWIDNRMEPQEIAVTLTRPYLNNEGIPTITNASVFLYNETKSTSMEFAYSSETGKYIWDPNVIGDSIGSVGDQFRLEVITDGLTYESSTVLYPVPTIDSITFEFYEEDLFVDQDYYWGDFWARDLAGPGDTYWIKSWKNGVHLNKPAELNFAYDAAFSEGSEFDSAFFIQPIRNLMNPFEEEETDTYTLDIAYDVGDTAYVEIHSISNDAWFFISRVADETNVDGGFGALFATPLANVPTNFTTSEGDVPVAGFFNLAAVSSRQQIVNEESIRDNRPQ